MNVFKKKGKAKDESYIIPPAKASENAPPSKMSRSLKRKQKNVVEPKLELDLATALPETNDFRTSLLMPGLSARFSMLREQDDPNTKVGKASDDSVLFPKRVSRLNLFSHNPLTEISETESLKGTFRPPFADGERSQSFSESGGYASDDGAGVMGRSRPVEGNNLFGGRQKMYRVPTAASSRELDDVQTPLKSGRHVYESDVPHSAYQQWRARGREDSRERPLSSETAEHENSSVVNTPSTGFSKSRGTASSTASGPSNRRTSTAATSVISDSPAARQSNVSANSNSRVTTTDFAAEENSLTRNFSSDSRKAFAFNENTNQPPLPSSPISSRALSGSRSVMNGSDKQANHHGPFAADTQRTTPPSPPAPNSALASLDFGLDSETHHARKFQTTSPISEQFQDEIYVKSLQPNDRGKATALGLFNRPRQQFDEQQFQERQLQMQQSRQPQEHNIIKSGDMQKSASSNRPRSPSSPSSKGFSRGHEQIGSGSNSTRQRAQSSASSSALLVQTQVEALVRRQNEEYTAFYPVNPAQKEANITTTRSELPPLSQPASRGTFFNTFDGSDEDDVDVDSPMLGRYHNAPRLAPLDVHPALRDGSQTFDFGPHVTAPGRVGRSQSSVSVDSSSSSAIHDSPDTSDSVHVSSPTKDTDSPTLGPAAGLGLSGLIRTHLRHDSDRSSLAPLHSPARTQIDHTIVDDSKERQPSVASTTRTINPPESTHSDPWEFDNAQQTQQNAPEHDPVPTMSQKAQQILGQAISHKQAATKANQILGNEAPVSNNEHQAMRPWQPDTLASHHRGESTETQKEFGNELAERARKIQEGLKGAPEHDSRTASPAPTRNDRHNPAAHAFQALRQKPSKTSLIPARGDELQPKAMKMLGISSNHPRMDVGGRSPNAAVMSGFESDDGYDSHGGRATPRQRPSEFEAPSGRRTPGYGRPPPPGPFHGPSEDYDRSRPRFAMPGPHGPRRERAESATGERSRSRMGREREEPPYYPADHSRHGPPQRPPPQWDQRRPRGPPPVHPRGPPPDPRDFERSSSAMSNRRPSNNRLEPSGYFESRSGTPNTGNSPLLGGGPAPIGAPRPSPRPPFPHSPMSPFQPGMSPGFAGPGPNSALPSPVVPMHPALTGRSTPVEGRAAPPGTRKKSVTKGMISEPTFISSTSSVPLVGLPISPRPGQIATPPVPVMNPRRRGNTMSERADSAASPRVPPSPMMNHLDRPTIMETQHQPPQPRARNRLRKISSEGGSMAAKARNQAMIAEYGHERLNSPALPVFPNRSATSLGVHQDGGMF